jgi:hypothetical protein
MQPEVILPEPFHRRILANEAPGGTAHSVAIVVPTITRPRSPFAAKVAILDAEGYPSICCTGALRLALNGSSIAEARFEEGQSAVTVIGNVEMDECGLFRLEGEYEGLRALSNPSYCTRENIPQVFWGDPHVHTHLSNCHPDTCRSLNFCYSAGRYLSGLDWVAAADHVSNGRCDRGKWNTQRRTAELYNDEGWFVTLPACEASLKGGSGGDNNVYLSHYPSDYVDEYEEGNVKTLCARLTQAAGEGEFFVVPHHTTRTGKHGEIPDTIYPGRECMPVVEIHSKWGTSEFRGNPTPLQHVHDGPSYVSDFLGRGMRLGFVAGTDTHATMPSGGGREPGHIDRLPGLTAVFASQLTRRAVFDAMRGRQCYAASLERIFMHGTIGGFAFGQEIRTDQIEQPLAMDIRIAAQSDIVAVDIVRNGHTVYTASPGSWQTRLHWTETEDIQSLLRPSRHSGRFLYYYVRVACTSGARAWSSPVWVLE